MGPQRDRYARHREGEGHPSQAEGTTEQITRELGHVWRAQGRRVVLSGRWPACGLAPSMWACPALGQRSSALLLLPRRPPRGLRERLPCLPGPRRPPCPPCQRKRSSGSLPHCCRLPHRPLGNGEFRFGGAAPGDAAAGSSGSGAEEPALGDFPLHQAAAQAAGPADPEQHAFREAAVLPGGRPVTRPAGLLPLPPCTESNSALLSPLRDEKEKQTRILFILL